MPARERDEARPDLRARAGSMRSAPRHGWPGLAKKFAAEGFTVCAGRRSGDKLAPLVADVEAQGGQILARSLDARKEADLTAFLQEADQHAPLEVCIFNIGANVNVPLRNLLSCL